MTRARRNSKLAARHAATVETSNDRFNEVLCRSVADLYMLMTNTPQGPYPYAGIPWYSTTFGRDGLITALADALARSRALRLASCGVWPPISQQSRIHSSDAQSGKILPRDARRRVSRFGRGAVRSILRERRRHSAIRYCRGSRCGTHRRRRDAGRVMAGLSRRHSDGSTGRAMPMATAWTEYYRATDLGLANQGWKDSHDAIFHDDGQLAEGRSRSPKFKAMSTQRSCSLPAGATATRLGNAGRSNLEIQAKQLAERFEAAFWCREIETYALALDGAKRPCRVRTSNAGQLLFTGIAKPERAAKIVDGLLVSDLFSGWGIRTVSNRGAAIQPHVLSQRFSLAARQRSHCAWLRSIRMQNG